MDSNLFHKMLSFPEQYQGKRLIIKGCNISYRDGYGSINFERQTGDIRCVYTTQELKEKAFSEGWQPHWVVEGYLGRARHSWSDLQITVDKAYRKIPILESIPKFIDNVINTVVLLFYGILTLIGFGFAITCFITAFK